MAIAGEGVRWLRDNLGIISSAAEIETVAGAVDGTHGVYFVPAFSGLLAPYWRHDARGTIVGLTCVAANECSFYISCLNDATQAILEQAPHCARHARGRLLPGSRFACLNTLLTITNRVL